MSGVLLGVTSETLLPPPHATSVRLANRTANTTRAERPVKRRRRRRRRPCRSGGGWTIRAHGLRSPHRQMLSRLAPRCERSHAPATCRTVVQVLLGELVAPGTEAKVLDRPGQPRGGGGEGEHLPDDLQRIAGLAVEIDLSGLGLDHDLPPAGGVAQAIALCTRGSPSGADIIGADRRARGDGGTDRLPVGARPDLPWLPARWDGIERLQRAPGRGAREARP